MAVEKVVIVGGGKVSKLHARAWREVGVEVVAVVEPRGPEVLPLELRGVRSVDHLDALGDLSRFVVDVCTPVCQMPVAATEAIALGSRSLILEKPVARSTRELDGLRRAADYAGARCGCVWNHHYSMAALELYAEIERLGEFPIEVHAAFDKNRVQESRDGRGTIPGIPNTAIDVELPHLVGLFIDLTGDRQPSVVAANVGDLVDEPNHQWMVEGMGMVRVRLLSRGGVNGTLTSNLGASQQHRQVTVVTPGFRIVATFEQTQGCLLTFDGRSGRCLRRLDVRDNSMLLALGSIYRALRAGSPSPTDLMYASAVVGVLEEAKRVAEADEASSCLTAPTLTWAEAE